MSMKCQICGKKAKWRWSPDLDIQGIGACSKHKKDVWLAYIALIQGTPDIYESLIESAKKYDQTK